MKADGFGIHGRYRLGTMGDRGAVLTVLLLGILIVNGATGASSALDNVAVQWNQLFSILHCKSTGALQEPNIIFAQLHLAQWHALLALKGITDASTTGDLVVAFASHTVLSNYFPYEQPTSIDPFLNAQITALGASLSAQTLGKRLGEAAALSLMATRRPAREFTLQALKAALTVKADPGLGVYRFLNDTAAGRDAATFVFYNIPIARPYVVPDPLRFIRTTALAALKPPLVPSREWDKAYASVVNAGRAGNPQRTHEMNSTAAVVGCPKVGSVACFSEQSWSAIARASLPSSLSLHDTVATLAKLAVTMHDALVVLSTLQYGFWFWRPQMAIRAGDPDHAPVPDWTPWFRTPPHPEYPSGTVTSYAAAAAVMERFFESHDEVPGNITLAGGGVFAPACPVSGAVPEVQFGSFAEAVAFAQRARVWSGAHFEQSVRDGKVVGETVARYVEEFWDDSTPSGVLPDPAYLNIVAALPSKQGAWSPIRLLGY